MDLIRLVDGSIIKTKVDTLNFDLTTDVLVVGAGCAGIYAAQSASSEGAKTTLIEESQSVGGMHVQGGVGGYYYGFPGGKFEDIDDLSLQDEKYFMASAYKDRKQIKYLEMLEESQVNLLFEHTPTGIFVDGNTVLGLKVFDGQKEINVGAKVTVDATSDGHLLKLLDVSKRLGRPLDGKTVPFSIISNYVWNNIRCGVNEDAGHVNQYDAKDFSDKLIFSHKQAARNFSKGEFLCLAQQLGVREGFSYQGEDTLRYSNIILDNPPKKVLFYAYSDLDRHGNDRALDEELFQSWWTVSNLATVAVRIAVPMGAIIPKGIKGFATAGRCFSCDTYSQSAVRMIRDMFRMGECVGVACALAVKSNKDILDVDYGEYLNAVNRRGCFNGDEYKKIGFDYPGKQKPYQAIEFDVDKNLHLLKTRTPGVAIWSCYVAKDRKQTADRLYSLLLKAQDDLEKYNCALALGLLNDERALDTLRKIVVNRDEFYFLDCRRSNQFRSASAICLLGRIGQKQDMELLESIVFNDQEINNPIYHSLKPDYLYYKLGDRNFVYFEIFTHAVASLVKLYKRHELSLNSLNERFKGLMAGDKIVRRITQVAPGEPAYDEIKGFMEQMVKQTQE